MRDESPVCLEGHTLRSRVHQVRDLGELLVVAAHRVGDQTVDIVATQRSQPQLVQFDPGAADLGQSLAQSRGLLARVSAQRPDQQQAAEARTDCSTQQVEARIVHPLQVVEEQNHRVLAGRDCAQEPADADVQAVPSLGGVEGARAGCLADQLGPARDHVGEDPEVRAEGGSHALGERRPALAFPRPEACHHVAQRLEDRGARRARSKLVVLAGHEVPAPAQDRRAQGLGQGRLADPRGPLQQHDARLMYAVFSR